MKRSLRAFGVGIFLVGAAWTGYDEYFAPAESEQIERLQKELATSEKQVAKLQQQLSQPDKAQASTNEEAEATTDKKQEAEVEKQKKETTKENTTSSKSKDASAEVVKGTVYIYEGVSLYDIGKQVEDLGVIENGRELELYLYKPEYARFIQKGQFELSSSMTIEQMAKILTGKKE